MPQGQSDRRGRALSQICQLFEVGGRGEFGDGELCKTLIAIRYNGEQRNWGVISLDNEDDILRATSGGSPQLRDLVSICSF